MSKWRIQLVGGDKIMVDEEKKKKIEDLWIAKKNVRIKIGEQLVDIASVRGIFMDEENVKQEKQELVNNLSILEINKEWNEDCSLWAKKSPEDKAKREMRVRVLNCWTLMGGKREDRALTELYYFIEDWFKVNPTYPRCTSSVWWNWLLEKGYLENKKPTHFSAILARQDGAVNEWVKWNK